MPMRRRVLPLLPLLPLLAISAGCAALTRPGEDLVPDPTVVAAAAPRALGVDGKVIGVANDGKGEAAAAGPRPNVVPGAPGGAAPAPPPQQPPSPIPAGARPQGG